MEHRIVSNEPMRQIAVWLQDVKRVGTDVGVATLVANLKRFKVDMPIFQKRTQVDGPANVTEYSGQSTPADSDVVSMPAARRQNRAPAVDDLGDGEINELDVLHKQIRYQQERINMHMQLERETQFPTKQGSADLDLMARLCVRAHDVRMDRGKDVSTELESVRPELRARVSERYGEELAQTVENPEASAKVLSLYSQLTKRAAELAGGPRADLG